MQKGGEATGAGWAEDFMDFIFERKKDSNKTSSAAATRPPARPLPFCCRAKCKELPVNMSTRPPLMPRPPLNPWLRCHGCYGPGPDRSSSSPRRHKRWDRGTSADGRGGTRALFRGRSTGGMEYSTPVFLFKIRL